MYRIRGLCSGAIVPLRTIEELSAVICNLVVCNHMPSWKTLSPKNQKYSEKIIPNVYSEAALSWFSVLDRGRSWGEAWISIIRDLHERDFGHRILLISFILFFLHRIFTLCQALHYFRSLKKAVCFYITKNQSSRLFCGATRRPHSCNAWQNSVCVCKLTEDP